MEFSTSILDTSERTDKECQISKFRNYASQILAVFATNIVKCTVGSSIGFTSVLVAELYKDDAEIHMSASDLSWFSSKLFIVPVGSLLLGTLAQRIGCRLTILISSIVYIISFLTFYFATSPEMILVAQGIGALFFLIAMGPGVTYVVEITQPPLRSALTASTTFSTICASFMVMLLSNFFHWKIIALVILIFPITGFIAVYFIPESPHWLANKNKLDEAEAAMCWLRGWCLPENISSEFNLLKQAYTKSPDVLDCQADKNIANWWSFFKNNIGFYSHKSFYIPLLSICLLFVLHICTGASPLSVFCIVIFKQMNAPIDSNVAASIFDAARILGAIVCIFSIHYTSKKKLVYISLIGAALSLFTSSIALLLDKYEIYSETCRWVAAMGMIFTTFLTSAGFDKVIGILNAEIFPTKYRNVGTAIGHFTNTVSQAISGKLFLSLMEAVTLTGIFCIFGVGCIVTCTVFHFLFPETEGKTLQEIENHFTGVKKTTENK